MNALAPRVWLGATLLVLMVATSLVGHRVQPRQQTQDQQGPGLMLDSVVPKAFGDWEVAPETAAIVVNPELQAQLGKLYSEILSRTYVDAQGYRVMVSAVYGGNQRGGLQAHEPEVCYPAQGFKLISNESAEIVTPFGAIQGRRLVTRRDSRHEPVTYWFSLGGKPVVGRLQSRFEELRFVLSGHTPEGVLFRVSSIDPDAGHAHRVQERFVAQMMVALPPDLRRRIGGL